MIARVLLILGAALLPCAAQAQYSTSLRGYINGLISLFEDQCYRAKAMEDASREEGDEQKAAMSHLAAYQICTCSPEQGRALLEKLPEEKLAEQVSDKEFTLLAKKEIIDVCIGRQMRATFGPEVCDARFKRPGFTAEQVTKACECMRAEIKTYSDEEAADIGIASADYIPQLAAAKKAGKPKPPTPPALERMFASLERCGMGGWW